MSPLNKGFAIGLPILAVIVIVGGAVYNQASAQEQRTERAEILTRGSADRGESLFSAYGCGSCHTLTRTPWHGQVGPPLDGVAQREIIGGYLQNTPDNMARWIGDPQGVAPGNAMPNLGIPDQARRDIAAFLYAKS